MNAQNISHAKSSEYEQENAMAALATAMSETSRMKMLCALMDGRAWTATELSAISGISTSTASAHLAKLLNANLVSCLSQGRHRYYRLYNQHIALLLENMMSVTFQADNPAKTRVPTELLKARTCYDHLAGEIAVKLYDALVKHRWITEDAQQLTTLGKEKLLQLGLNVNEKVNRKVCCPCLDWSERKYHLGGYIGASLLLFFEKQHWIEKTVGYREVKITNKGNKALKEYFEIEV